MNWDKYLKLHYFVSLQLVSVRMHLNTFGIAVSVCTLVLDLTAAFSDAELKEIFKVGLRNIKREIVNGEVTVEYGVIPTWLSGMYQDIQCYICIIVNISDRYT